MVILQVCVFNVFLLKPLWKLIASVYITLFKIARWHKKRIQCMITTETTA